MFRLVFCAILACGKQICEAAELHLNYFNFIWTCASIVAADTIKCQPKIRKNHELLLDFLLFILRSDDFRLRKFSLHDNGMHVVGKVNLTLPQIYPAENSWFRREICRSECAIRRRLNVLLLRVTLFFFRQNFLLNTMSHQRIGGMRYFLAYLRIMWLRYDDDSCWTLDSNCTVSSTAMDSI